MELVGEDRKRSWRRNGSGFGGRAEPLLLAALEAIEKLLDVLDLDDAPIAVLALHLDFPFMAVGVPPLRVSLVAVSMNHHDGSRDRDRGHLDSPVAAVDAVRRP